MRPSAAWKLLDRTYDELMVSQILPHLVTRVAADLKAGLSRHIDYPPRG